MLLVFLLRLNIRICHTFYGIKIVVKLQIVWHTIIHEKQFITGFDVGTLR